MHVLGQMLTPDLRALILREATTFGDKWLEWQTRKRRGTQNIPPSYWEPSGSNKSHFVICILEGLKQMHAKTLNYDKLADIQQERRTFLVNS